MNSSSPKAIKIGAIIVVLFQLFHLYGLHHAKDLPLWDEAAYISWGDEYVESGDLRSFTNSPLYQFLYGILVETFGITGSFYAMQYLMKVALTLLIYFLGIRFAGSVSLGLIIALLFSYSSYHIKAEVLVYYGALVPFVLALLTISRWPILAIGFAFLSGLGRTENFAIALAAICYIGYRRFFTQNPIDSNPKRPLDHWIEWGGSVIVWGISAYIISCITVWQFHNRIWFAWSQNFAYYKVETGSISGLNPWLEHTIITQADFPGAQSLSDAWRINPGAVLEHTWFNIMQIPGSVSDYVRSLPLAPLGVETPVLFLGGVTLFGIISILTSKKYRHSFVSRLTLLRLEATLCAGGIISAIPAILVTTRTPYITSLLPAILLAIGCTWQPKAFGKIFERRVSFGFLFLASIFVLLSLFGTREYPLDRPQLKPPHLEDIETLRTELSPYFGLKFLGVSTHSYVKYLGKRHQHTFVEIHAISPIHNEQVDRTLLGLISANEPDAILINSFWAQDPNFDELVNTDLLHDWHAIPLRDGSLYLKPGILLNPQYLGQWHDSELLGESNWRWSAGNSTIRLENSVSERKANIAFTIQSFGDRQITLQLQDQTIFGKTFSDGETQSYTLESVALNIGANDLIFETDQPGTTPSNSDNRQLAFRVIDFKLEPIQPSAN